MVAVLAVAATPPPTIYHVVTRPLCGELHEHIAPAIGMMLQNDTTIKKSPALFKQYNEARLYSSDPSTTRRAGTIRSRATPAAARTPRRTWRCREWRT